MQRRRPLAIVPPTLLGRGQLLDMLVLWPMVLGTFAKALPGFTDQRLLTEGSNLVCAVIVTVLVLLLPGRPTPCGTRSHVSLGALAKGAIAALILAAIAAPLVETAITRAVYGNAPAGHAASNRRFGPDANWRTKPILKGTPLR